MTGLSLDRDPHPVLNEISGFHANTGIRNHGISCKQDGKMVRIYGASDDLVEIDGSKYDNEIGCESEDCRIWFEDGTVIHITYGKGLRGIWNIVVEKVGTAEFSLQICEDEDADIYSDIFEIDSEIVRHEVVQEW